MELAAKIDVEPEHIQRHAFLICAPWLWSRLLACRYGYSGPEPLHRWPWVGRLRRWRVCMVRFLHETHLIGSQCEYCTSIDKECEEIMAGDDTRCRACFAREGQCLESSGLVDRPLALLDSNLLRAQRIHDAARENPLSCTSRTFNGIVHKLDDATRLVHETRMFLNGNRQDRAQEFAVVKEWVMGTASMLSETESF